jgi:hypothetical protein
VSRAPDIPARRPPHAPFRAGAPRFVPALRPIERDAWLLPDSEAHVLDWKQALLTDARTSVRLTPGGGEAAAEAADCVGEALGRACHGDLVAASRGLSDDLVVMAPGPGGWTCVALTLTAPTFFSIDAVIGRDLAALHGPTPDSARLSARIARVFDGLAPGVMLERFNWTLQAGAERHTPDAAPLHALAQASDPGGALDILHLRVERQTLCALPHTGAVLFTIRVCLDPLAALARADRAGLANAWRSLEPAGRAYKGWAAYERLAAAAFSAWAV